MGQTEGVAPDGSPVAVYLRLPLEPEFTPLVRRLDGAIPAGASVLDLGCGVGRLANHLASRGYRVVGVDESAAMLAHLADPVLAVRSAIEELRLDEEFDIVVLASHFVNVADLDQRQSLLQTVAAHLASGGSAFLERYDPDWMADVGASDGHAGDVRVRFEVLERAGEEFAGRVSYVLDDRRWEQEFRARIVDDEELDTALQTVGLVPSRTLDERGTWVEAVHLERS